MLRYALQGADEVCPLQVLGVVCPHVLQHLLDVQLSELVQDIAHQAAFANRLLHLRESHGHGLLAADDASHRARDLAQDVVRRVDGLFARRNSIGQALYGVQSRVDERDGHHPHHVLHARGQRRYLGEDALIRWPGHDARLRPLGATVWSDNRNSRSQILDKVPTDARDGEDVVVRADVSHNLNRSVMLEQEIHFRGNAPNVFEHRRGLHVIRIRAISIKARRHK